MGRRTIVLVSKVFAASLVLALPLYTAGPARAQTDDVFNMTCKSQESVTNWVINPRAQTISEDGQIPNHGGSPDPILYSSHYPDLSKGFTSTVQVNDASVVWTITTQIPGRAGPTTFTLNRYSGVLRQTREPGGAYPNGQDITWTCERKQKAF